MHQASVVIALLSVLDVYIMRIVYRYIYTVVIVEYF
jgi:hypothetical protein